MSDSPPEQWSITSSTCFPPLDLGRALNFDRVLVSNLGHDRASLSILPPHFETPYRWSLTRSEASNTMQSVLDADYVPKLSDVRWLLRIREAI